MTVSTEHPVGYRDRVEADISHLFTWAGAWHHIAICVSGILLMFSKIIAIVVLLYV